MLKKKFKSSGRGKIMWKKMKNGVKVIFASGQVRPSEGRIDELATPYLSSKTT